LFTFEQPVKEGVLTALNYQPLPVTDFLRVIAKSAIVNAAPDDDPSNHPQFNTLHTGISAQFNLTPPLTRRLPPILAAAVTFLRKAQHYDYFNLYGIPFITDFATAVFGWNIRFLLARDHFPERRILIHGETGTGKEQVARLIGDIITGCNHSAFMAVNAANLSETLMEAELFGYVKGAFTGAAQNRDGILHRLGNGGVLFLDEISETPPAIQARLLRLLETGEYRPVGSTRTFRAHLSIAAASNRPDLFDHRTLRSDVLYRLSEAIIRLPPLRDITADPHRAVRMYDHLVLSVAREMTDGIDPVEQREYLAWVSEHGKRLAQQLATRWTGRSWPGNIRECRNAIRGVIMQCRDDLDDGIDGTAGLKSPLPSATDTLPVDLKAILEQVERQYYLRAASRATGIEAVARQLGVTRQTASRRLKAFKININRRPNHEHPEP